MSTANKAKTYKRLSINLPPELDRVVEIAQEGMLTAMAEVGIAHSTLQDDTAQATLKEDKAQST